MEDALWRRNMISSVEGKLRSFEYIEGTKERLTANLHWYLTCLEQIELAKSKTEMILVRAQEAQKAFKSERLELLELQMQENLKQVYPKRNFRVKFKPDVVRGKEVLTLLVGEGVRMSPTKMQNGRLLRQIINLSACTLIQIIGGCKVIILDEATNSGDEDSIKLVAPIFKNLMDLGYQLFCTEHKHEVYKDLPRRQFYCYYDDMLQQALIREVIDYE